MVPVFNKYIAQYQKLISMKTSTNSGGIQNQATTHLTLTFVVASNCLKIHIGH